MISETMQASLNQQAAAEAAASSNYLAMALWCDSNGLEIGRASCRERV
jgi:ferritin